MNGNLTSFIDARGGELKYTYDVANSLSGFIDATLASESRFHDGNHNLVSTTDRKGQTTQYTYDGLNRLTLTTFHDGSTISRTYDAGDRVTQLIDSNGGSVSFTYDDLDNILTETTSKGGVSYTYFPDGLRKTMAVAGRPLVRYTYDEVGRLTQLMQEAGPSNGNTPQLVLLSYDQLGNRKKVTLPNSTSMNYTYDEVGHVSSITFLAANGSLLGDLNYTYDEAGNRTGVGGSFARSNLPATSITSNADAANRLTNFGTSQLTHDANGNLLFDGTNRYVWNARNELVEITDVNGVSKASFKYDALGRRISKLVAGVGVGYVYDGLNVVQKLNGINTSNDQSGSIAASYLVGLDLDDVFAVALAGQGGDQMLSYFRDGIGSVVRVSDSAGAKLAETTYDPYGTMASDSAIDEQYQYTGRELDATGLMYYRARYYAPWLSRFISEDPIGIAGGTNFYAYANGDPVSLTDPLGLAAQCGAGGPNPDKCKPVCKPGPGSWQVKLARAVFCVMCLINNKRPPPEPPPPPPPVKPEKPIKPPPPKK